MNITPTNTFRWFRPLSAEDNVSGQPVLQQLFIEDGFIDTWINIPTVFATHHDTATNAHTQEQETATPPQRRSGPPRAC